MRFSTANTRPWEVVTPIAVDPSCKSREARFGQKETAASRSHLYGFHGILDLKDATFGAEGVNTPIIFRTREEHAGRKVCWQREKVTGSGDL